MKTTIAIVLASVFTLTAAQTGELGPVIAGSPSPLPATVSAPLSSALPVVPSAAAPISNSTPASTSNNSTAPPSNPNTGSDGPVGITVHILPDPNGDGATPVVIGPNGPEPVQLVVGPGGTPAVQAMNGLIPVANIIGPNGEPLRPVMNNSTTASSTTARVPAPGASGMPVPLSSGSGTALGTTTTPSPVPTPSKTPSSPNMAPKLATSGGPKIPQSTVAPVEASEQTGYYNSSARSFKVTSTFVLIATVVAIFLV